jgi:hypothetical protein
MTFEVMAVNCGINAFAFLEFVRAVYEYWKSRPRNAARATLAMAQNK